MFIASLPFAVARHFGLHGVPILWTPSVCTRPRLPMKHVPTDGSQPTLSAPTWTTYPDDLQLQEPDTIIRESH